MFKRRRKDMMDNLELERIDRCLSILYDINLRNPYFKKNHVKSEISQNIETGQITVTWEDNVVGKTSFTFYNVDEFEKYIFEEF